MALVARAHSFIPEVNKKRYENSTSWSFPLNLTDGIKSDYTHVVRSRFRGYDRVSNVLDRAASLEAGQVLKLSSRAIQSIVKSINTQVRMGSSKLNESLRKTLVANLESEISHLYGDSVSFQGTSGQFDFNHAYYEFFANELDIIPQSRQMVGLHSRMIDSVGHFKLNKGVVVACDRPSTLSFDKDNFLHSMTEKAISYHNGWGVYVIHGVTFLKYEFEKVLEGLTATDILSWPNVDQRAALLKELPPEKILKDLEAKLIHKTSKCGGYKLYQVTVPFRGRRGEIENREVKILTYKAWSSDKEYAKFVPPNSIDCLQTAAGLRGMTVEDFKKAVKS